MKTVIVHTLAQVKAAAGYDVMLQTAPGAAAYAGIGYLLAIGQEGCVPPERFILDCGDDPALATEAMRLGATRLRVDLPPEMLKKVRDIADQQGVVVVTDATDTLDLAGSHDPAAFIAAWLGR